MLQLQSGAFQLTVSSVACDAKQVLSYWLQLDYEYFRSQLSAVLLSGERLYETTTYRNVRQRRGQTEISKDLSHHNHNHNHHHQQQQQQHNQRQVVLGSVFKIIHFCCFLYSLAWKRYQRQTAKVQALFARHILEPILRIAVGILLYRVRTCPVLILMRKGQLPASKGVNGVSFSAVYPEELSSFVESCAYLSRAVEAITVSYNFALPQVTEPVQRWRLCMLWIKNVARLKEPDFAADIFPKIMPLTFDVMSEVNSVHMGLTVVSRAASSDSADDRVETKDFAALARFMRSQADALSEELQRQFLAAVKEL